MEASIASMHGVMQFVLRLVFLVDTLLLEIDEVEFYETVPKDLLIVYCTCFAACK